MQRQIWSSNRALKAVLLLLLPVTLLFAASARAGSATWSATPANGTYNSASNWVPNTVPNQVTDTATFDVSNITGISLSSLTVGAMMFDPGASAYTFSAPATDFVNLGFAQGGAGVVNNSGVAQNFVMALGGLSDGTSRNLGFINNASAGNEDVTYTIFASADSRYLAGQIQFEGNSSAGSANFIVGDPHTHQAGFAPVIFFRDSSTAGTATFHNSGEIDFQGGGPGAATIYNEGAAEIGAAAGLVTWTGTQEGSATIISNSGAVPGAAGAVVGISAENSDVTFIGNGGPGDGAQLDVGGKSPETSRARVEVFGNAELTISGGFMPVSYYIGSLEGDGLVFLGYNTLVIGSNDLSTTFSGLIQDGPTGTEGGLGKIGRGTLILTGANIYTGQTNISNGRFIVQNTSGSATGAGPVQVNAGSLGGSGTIAGPVTVGDDRGRPATVSPSAGGSPDAILHIQGALTLGSDAVYSFRLRANSHRSISDATMANGVTIDGSAIFQFGGTVGGQILVGTSFTVITNTSATPIAGAFSNLPDGGAVSFGGNNFQANYEGGDGNDLTLTVVP